MLHDRHFHRPEDPEQIGFLVFGYLEIIERGYQVRYGIKMLRR
jgi:hypothetical protein